MIILTIKNLNPWQKAMKQIIVHFLVGKLNALVFLSSPGKGR